LELKPSRAKKRLVEQVTHYAALVEAHLELFGELCSVILGRELTRDLDFHGYAWVHADGGVLFDPLPMSEHDLAHLARLGPPPRWIAVSNRDHVRAASELAARLGAAIAGPAGERGDFPLACARWLAHGDELVPGLRTIAFPGSKTPGELAFALDGTTLIAGDLIRGHRGGALNLLPDAKLRDKAAALGALRELVAAFPDLEAVLVGDGWPVFRDGRARLRELCDRVTTTI
jgi:hypothetical protein